MMGEPFDVAVVGAGPVGLAGALALARTGLRVCLVGPEPERRDGRTAALLAPSVDLLTGLGVWPAIAPGAGALRVLRIVDDTGSLFRPPPVAFRADEIGLEAFGWNVVNGDLADALANAVRAEPGLAWRRALATGFEAGEAAILQLADGSAVSASLVVAADGRASRVREAAGIGVSERRYPQAAFTTILRHARDHGDTSTEFHTRAGPMTFVPLPGRRSSLVWVTEPHHARRLAAADDATLAGAILAASHHLLGPLAIDGPRGTVPLATVLAERVVGDRLALAGEAAHLLPPIGAQGLNLGFADIAALVELADAARREGRDLGGPEGLGRYGRARRSDIRLRSTAVDGLNRALLSSLWPLDAVRGLGLGLLGQVGPLRRAVMRAGLPGAAPRASRGTGSAARSRS